MNEDLVIRQKVWNGTVPVCFVLADNDFCGGGTTGEKPPRPLFCNVPRNTYLTLNPMSKIREHFDASAPITKQEIWFETAQGIPLKWNIPVGVLYDIYSNDQLPWQLIVHYTAFPADQILRCPNIQTIKSHFMNTLKQSTYVKHNGIKVINDFSIKESTDIWEGFMQGNYERFWSVNTKLVSNLVRIPVRICRGDKPFVQVPAPLQDEKGEPSTVLTVLKSHMPEVIETTDEGIKVVPGVKIIVQGIEVPLDTPLEWLSAHMAHPDGFLYIICS